MRILKSPTRKWKRPHFFPNLKYLLQKIQKRFIYKNSSAYRVKKLSAEEKEMLEDPTFQNGKTERKAAIKAERDE